MSLLLSALDVVLQDGFMYAILAMGYYISYTILDFPDLTVEGTVVTGGVVFGLLTRAGVWGYAILKQLYTGKNYSLFCVQRAEELAAGGPVLLEHWQQAARDFGILEG